MSNRRALYEWMVCAMLKLGFNFDMLQKSLRNFPHQEKDLCLIFYSDNQKPYTRHEAPHNHTMKRKLNVQDVPEDGPPLAPQSTDSQSFQSLDLDARLLR